MKKIALLLFSIILLSPLYSQKAYTDEQFSKKLDGYEQYLNNRILPAKNVFEYYKAEVADNMQQSLAEHNLQFYNPLDYSEPVRERYNELFEIHKKKYDDLIENSGFLHSPELFIKACEDFHKQGIEEEKNGENRAINIYLYKVIFVDIFVFKYCGYDFKPSERMPDLTDSLKERMVKLCKIYAALRVNKEHELSKKFQYIFIIGSINQRLKDLYTNTIKDLQSIEELSMEDREILNNLRKEIDNMRSDELYKVLATEKQKSTLNNILDKIEEKKQ